MLFHASMPLSSCALWGECTCLLSLNSSFIYRLFQEGFLTQNPKPLQTHPRIVTCLFLFGYLSTWNTLLWLHLLPQCDWQVCLFHKDRDHPLFVLVILRAGTVGTGVRFVGQMDTPTDGWMDEWIQINVVLFTKSQNFGTRTVWMKEIPFYIMYTHLALSTSQFILLY